MSKRNSDAPIRTITVPFNRVEGDLEIEVEIDDGVVSDAWSRGTMYRGFENIMVGRAPLDGLVITPRICGICSTSHLSAAAKALDMISGVEIPDNARRIRNIALMVEQLQNDMRHAFMLFMPDFCHADYQDFALFEAVHGRYAPLKGSTTIQAIQQTKQLLEIVAIIGGQWPHSSFMVPGGVVSLPSASEMLHCAYLLKNFRTWYEKQVMGCRLERWFAIESKSDLMAWLEESESHREGDLGIYIRFSQMAKLDKIGKTDQNFISFGSFDMPKKTKVTCPRPDERLLPAGFAVHTDVASFDQSNIIEDISCAWFAQDDTSGHPFSSTTTPYATGRENGKYSWAKAPRYNGMTAETGPLAEMVMSGNPLFTDLVKTDGASVFVRELARLTRAATVIPALETWIKETAVSRGASYRDYGMVENGEGFGLIEAPRGALGHWVKIIDGRIVSYQIITPTTWNASPRDKEGQRGPLEKALLGTKIDDKDNPVLFHHIIRSFDPCLVCTVHTIDLQNDAKRVRIGKM